MVSLCLPKLVMLQVLVYVLHCTFPTLHFWMTLYLSVSPIPLPPTATPPHPASLDGWLQAGMDLHTTHLSEQFCADKLIILLDSGRTNARCIIAA